MGIRDYGSTIRNVAKAAFVGCLALLPNTGIADDARTDQLNPRYNTPIQQKTDGTGSLSDYFRIKSSALGDLSLTGGVDLEMINIRSINVKQPSLPLKGVTFNGRYFDVGYGERPVTVTADLKIPSTINRNSIDTDMGFYIGVESAKWPGVKIGIRPVNLVSELNSVKGAPTSKGRVGDEDGVITSVDYGLRWGNWPIGGVSMKIDRKNLLWFEVGLYRDVDTFKGIPWSCGEILLTGRMDSYDLKWTKWTSDYPFGSEWSSSLKGMLMSEETLDTAKCRTLSLGIKSRGKDLLLRRGAGLANIYFSLSLEREFPLTDDHGIEVDSWLGGLNIGLEW